MPQHTVIAAWQWFGKHELRRVVLWGVAAAVALTVAVYAATTDVGRNRLALTATKAPSAAPARPAAPDDNTRKLTEALQALTADRDRLAARLDTLERNIGEITGSIGRLAAAPPPTQPAPATPMVVPSILAVAPPEVAPPAPSPMLAPSAEPTHQEFGIDLGGAANIEGLRALWAAAKIKHGGLLEGLRPIIAVRNRTRPGRVELRLVVGPFGNAAGAARLCSVIAASGAICQPTLFDGQRLALR